MADGVAKAWKDYQASLEKMYGPAAEGVGLTEMGAMTEAPPENLVDEALAKSEALGEAIAVGLQDEDSSRRELAELQLSAAAVVDLSVADDLAGPAEETTVELAPAARLSTVFEEVAPILEATPEGGIGGSILAGGAPALDGDPRERLSQAVDSALTGIRDDAADSALAAFKVLIKLPGTALLDAAASAVDRIFDGVDKKVGLLLRKAVAFVLKGITKILSIFGSAATAMMERVTQWVSEVDEDSARRLLDSLYRIDDANAQLRKKIEEASREADSRMGDAADALRLHEQKFERQMTILSRVIWVAERIRGWLWNATPPLSHAAVAAAFLAATGYAIAAGGDYIDWDGVDGGMLNLVPGVRSIVEEAL